MILGPDPVKHVSQFAVSGRGFRLAGTIRGDRHHLVRASEQTHTSKMPGNVRERVANHGSNNERKLWWQRATSPCLRRSNGAAGDRARPGRDRWTKRRRDVVRGDRWQIGTRRWHSTDFRDWSAGDGGLDQCAFGIDLSCLGCKQRPVLAHAASWDVPGARPEFPRSFRRS